MSEVKRSGRSLGALAIIDQCFFSGTNFLTSVLLGRFGGPEELGFYTLVFSAAVFLMAFERSMLISPYVVIRDRLESAGVRSMRLSLLVTAIAAGLLCSIFAALVYIATGWAIVLGLICVFPAAVLRDLMRRLALSEFRLFEALGIDISTSILQLGTLVTVIVYRGGNIDALAALLCCAAVWATVGLTALVVTNQRFRASDWDLRSDHRALWPIGRWVGVSQVISTAQGYALPWLLTAAHSVKAAGLYAACWTLVQAVAPAIEGLGNVLSPALAKSANGGDWKRFASLVNKATALFTTLMLGFLAATLLLGEFMLRHIYGTSYAELSHVFVLLALAATIGNAAIPSAKAITQLGRPSVNSAVSAISLGVVVAASLFGLTWIGIAGAAWGLILANLFSTVTRGLAYRRLHSDQLAMPVPDQSPPS